MAGNTGLQKKQQDLWASIETRKEQIADRLPPQLTVQRFMQIVRTNIRDVPSLTNCSPATVFGAICEAASLGLEPGSSLGEAHLVPYGKKCQLIIGYRGLMDLARRTGEIKTVFADVVYKGDKFHVQRGTDPKIEHEPSESVSRDQVDSPEIRGFYAVAVLKDGAVQFEWLTKSEVDGIKAKAAAGKDGPWITHYVQMGKKTAIRRLANVLPRSVELRNAIYLDEKADRGQQDFTDAIDIPFDGDESNKSPLKGVAEKAAEAEDDNRKRILESIDTGISNLIEEGKTAEVEKILQDAFGLPSVPEDASLEDLTGVNSKLLALG